MPAPSALNISREDLLLFFSLLPGTLNHLPTSSLSHEDDVERLQ